MELELRSFLVDCVEDGPETKLQGTTLLINRAELRAKALDETRLEDVTINVALPGDSARIIHVMDVVEPRCKEDPSLCAFPGVTGPLHQAGEGVTHRLKGVAVVQVGPPSRGGSTWWWDAIIDMSGPAAEIGPFGMTCNIVMEAKPRPGVNHNDFNLAVRIAGARVAEFLAGVTRGLQASESQTLSLQEQRPDLPNAAYVYQMYTSRLYGHIDSELIGTQLHPNEILDGAVTNGRNGPASTRPVTYLDQNNAVIKELYEGHLKQWNFVGVVVYSGHDTNLLSKERSAIHVAKLVRLLGANGAILTYLSGGHPCINLMLVCRELERSGIKTTMIINEMAATPEDSGFVHFEPEAVAIVNSGNFEEELTLPPVECVIGGEHLLEGGFNAAAEIVVLTRQILGCTSQFGYGNLQAVRY